MTEGENASDLSSSLTLRISNENCGESDLTAEHMAEGISSSLDCGSAFKFGNIHEQGQIFFPLVLNSEGNVERSTSRERGIAIHNKSFRCESEKDAGMGKWLELGLGSIHTVSKCPPLVQHSYMSFTQDSSPANKEQTSRLNTRNQPLIPKLSPQIDYQFPYGLTYGRGMASTLPSSSCDLDRNRLYCSSKTKISAEYPSHKHGERKFEDRHGSMIKTSGDNFMYQNSQQSAVLQNVRDIIQSRRPWTSDGEFAWIRSGDFRPAISDISVGRKLSSNGLPATIQYQSSKCIQPMATYKGQHKQISAQFTGTQPITTNISQTENGKAFKPRKREGGVWFRLQVAPTKDGDRLLPQISKTYLRIKDGTTTVLLVKKYLASKLGLKSESEIEITCRGQAVLPLLTLQHVRDEIWCSSMKKESNQSKTSSASFLSKYSNECLMVLNYQRSLSAQ
ncbi:uncharacterized protein LOC131077035 [Cryptomeria japonica]|uniref:uncharacterized protein LOC131077035 n=1 Tax=Cryptomeria japonica TaxID=3369 RepID=UPI0027DA78E5|nr:uncharacterized protein LOC131077035 [Cryptomeria japonica]